MPSSAKPPADRYASCPDGGRVLDYYAGIFEAVYVVLSPFVRPVSISPAVFTPETYPNRQTNIETCQAVTWREVMSLTGLSSISEVDVGLRTMNFGLGMEYRNEQYADLISSLVDRAGIFPPSDGAHSDLLHNSTLELFLELGHEWVWVGDQFCMERTLHRIEDLLTEKAPTIRRACNVFSPDASILWTVHWDSHFSFLCSSRENLERVNAARRLEGFFCDATTEVYWSVLNSQGESK